MIELRPYQSASVGGVRQSYAAGKRAPLLVLPTGGGKTTIFSYVTSSAAAFERVRDRIAETGLPKIENLRFHDLRHTGITQLFWAGLKIEEVAQVSGHTNWAQLKRYTHIRPEDVHRRWNELKG